MTKPIVAFRNFAKAPITTETGNSSSCIYVFLSRKTIVYLL
jgi:hypothetical protein